MADAANAASGAATGNTATGSTSQEITAPASPGATPPVASAAATPPTTETVNPGSWMAGMNDDLKGYVGLKGFKGPGDVVDAYRNFEKLQGVPQDRVMKLPEKFYDDAGALTPEGRAIFEKVGAPKEAKDYDLQRFIPKENGDPKLMERFSEVFKDAGVSKSAAEKIVASWNELQTVTMAQMKEATAQKFKDEQGVLLKDWGAAFDQNTQIAREGAKRMGHDTKTMDALSAVLGHAATMKLYHQMGSAVGESAFIGGKQVNQFFDPSTALAQINALKADKGFVAKYNAGDAEAVSKMTKLHEMAHQGRVTF